MSEQRDTDLLFKLIIQGINNLSETVSKTDSRIDHMDKILERNTESLIHHVKRTDLLEKQLAPIRSIYEWLVISGKVLGVLALVVAVVGGVFEGGKVLLEFIRNVK